MDIYVAHSKDFDFKKELYEPLKKIDGLNFVFPHDSDEFFSSKELFETRNLIVLAECSIPATGVGIELGWAELLKHPIIILSKKGKKISSSLKSVSNTFIEYESERDLIEKVDIAVNDLIDSKVMIN